MIKEIISIICLLLVFLGLVALAYYIILRILRSKKGGKFIVIIMANCCSNDVASRLCSEYMRMELLGELSYGNIVVLDCGMKCEERRRCEEFCRQTNNIYVCNPCEFERLTVKLLKD